MLTGEGFQAHNFSRLTDQDDLKGPATHLAVGDKTLVREAGIYNRFHAGTAVRATQGGGNFHNILLI